MIIFISYNRADRAFARRLRDTLRDAGHDPWIYLEDIAPGARWPDEVDEALQRADAVVAVFSQDSMDSPYCRNEWDWAIENNTPLIPLLCRPCKVRHRYVNINRIDCSADERAGIDKLLASLTAGDLRTPYRDDKSAALPRSIATDQPEREKNLGILLQKVRNFWVQGVLEPAKVGDVWLDLPADERPDAVEPTARRKLEHPDFEAVTLDSGAQIADVFRKTGRALLILGAPGSGKTMTLLELASDLLDEAETQTRLPVPVVLNLASWAEQRPADLAEWLIERLFMEYGVPRKLSARWIADGDLLFLLDGLDEVSADHRAACVTAINAFWRAHDFTDNGIVVCSRIDEYNDLTARLHLEHAITLQPVPFPQAAKYLDDLGADWADLRAAIEDDPVLREFTTSPLLLNIMAVAYRGIPRAQITGFADPADQKRDLFNRYIDHRLREDKAHPKYPHKDTRHYLAWLGKKMVENDLIVFEIESLQPHWSNEKLTMDKINTKERLHWSWPRARTGLTIGLGIGLAFGLFAILIGTLGAGLGVGLLVGLITGLGVGLFAGLVAMLGMGLGTGKIELRGTMNQGIRASMQSAFVAGCIFGSANGLVIGLFAGLISGPIGGLIIGLIVALVFGLAAGLDYGSRAVIRHLILRRMFYRNGDAPLNYAEFLQYTSSRHLTRQVGGGFIFRHRMLMEHFADSDW
ncbi:MAG: TIR domain-containing protein [Anaerolineae bacterium]|nr:TIR domain-containing protein [Anaerolineae bacterium]